MPKKPKPTPPPATPTAEPQIPVPAVPPPEPPPPVEPTMGRPLKFTSVEELQERIEAYFHECDREEDTRVLAHGDEIAESIPYFDDKNKRRVKKRAVCSVCHMDLGTRGCKLVSGELKLRKPYTVTGLAVWLDTSRQTLLEYQGAVPGRDRDPAFADTILRAKQRVEHFAEEKLFDDNYPTKGVIFSLSNNYERWAEKIETKDASIADLIKAQQATTPPDAGDPRP